jgi:hypothetical protein
VYPEHIPFPFSNALALFEIEDIFADMKNTPRKAEYFLTTVRAMFNWAEHKRIIDRNPVRYVKFRKPHVPNRFYRFS